MAKIWSVQTALPNETAIDQAAEMIRQGGIVVTPTRGLYGLCGEAFQPQTVQRIFRIKGRTVSKALLVLIDRMEWINRVARIPGEHALHLMQQFWPGKVTFVLPAQPELPLALTAGSAKVGVRWVAHPVAAALVRAVGAPLTGTSANISGAAGCASVQELDHSILAGVDGVLDAGPLAGGPGSTVVDLSGTHPIILREGVVAGNEILDRYRALMA